MIHTKENIKNKDNFHWAGRLKNIVSSDNEIIKYGKNFNNINGWQVIDTDLTFGFFPFNNNSYIYVDYDRFKCFGEAVKASKISLDKFTPFIMLAEELRLI